MIINVNGGFRDSKFKIQNSKFKSQDIKFEKFGVGGKHSVSHLAGDGSSGVRFAAFGQLLGCAFEDNIAAGIAAFRT